MRRSLAAMIFWEDDDDWKEMGIRFLRCSSSEKLRKFRGFFGLVAEVVEGFEGGGVVVGAVAGVSGSAAHGG